MENKAEYTCTCCVATNLTFIGLSAEMQQSYVKDCQVCCQPNILSLLLDEEIAAVAFGLAHSEWLFAIIGACACAFLLFRPTAAD